MMDETKEEFEQRIYGDLNLLRPQDQMPEKTIQILGCTNDDFIYILSDAGKVYCYDVGNDDLVYVKIDLSKAREMK